MMFFLPGELSITVMRCSFGELQSHYCSRPSRESPRLLRISLARRIWSCCPSISFGAA